MPNSLCLCLCVVVGLITATRGFVQQMSESDKQSMEKHFPRSKRDINLRLPINFANLPRLDVVTIEHEPYTIIEKDGQGGTTTKGFMTDLMFLVGRRLGMQINFYTPPDGKWGSRLQDGSWTGMMGEVMKRENYIQQNKSASGSDPIGMYGADISAAPLTITAEREEDVDFVKPFAHLGLTALVQKPDSQGSDWPYDFDILKPLSAPVWASVIVTSLLVWLFVFIMNILNPYEYGQRMKNNLASEEDGSLFDLQGSFWFMFTILQWQGYDRSPRCLASKVLGCFWMLFVTLFLVVYTGAYINNLFWASTVHGQDPSEPTVRTLADLVMHKDDYTYGTLKGGSTYKYLMEVAKGEEFTVLQNYLAENPSQLMESYSKGVERVRSDPKYAFLCETMMAYYETNKRPCNLTTISESFGKRSYGLAVAKNSPLLNQLHVIILELLEEGDIEALEKKWFEIKGECWNVTKKAEKERAEQSQVLLNKPKTVSLGMMWSAFVIMAVGLVVSSVVAIGEILWFRYRGRYAARNRQPGQPLTTNPNNDMS